MNRKRALELLTRRKCELPARFDLIRPALFGSSAKHTEASSDVFVFQLEPKDSSA